MIREMGNEGIGQALKLINDEGWGYTPVELERMVKLDPHGSFLYGDDPIAGVVTCVTYSKTGVVGHLVVAKNHRGKRLGKTLMQKAVDYCESRGCESIVLFATEQGQRLYERFGFVVKREAYCVHAKVQTKDMGPDHNPCEPIREEDLDEITGIDEKLFGDGRSRVLPALLEEFPRHSWKLVRDGRIAGYALGRSGPAGFDLGPWVCTSGGADAELLLRAVLRSFGPGHVYMSGFADNKGARGMADSLELINSWNVKFMVRGRDRYPKDDNEVFGVVSFELG